MKVAKHGMATGVRKKIMGYTNTKGSFMKVAICDDDAKLRNYYAELTQLVANKSGIPVSVDTYEKGEQLLFALSSRNDPPDILFLDIFMPGIDGINLGSDLVKNGFIGSIIYLTRSQDHMLSAFDVGASNYIIKGEEFDSGRFEKVFFKAAKEVERRKRKHILLNGIGEHRNIAIDSISYFEIRKYRCIVHYNKDETFEFVSPLHKIENALRVYGFVRSYKSYLINCEKVASYNAKQIVLNDGTELPMGRKYYPDVKEAMTAYAEEEFGNE